MKKFIYLMAVALPMLFCTGCNDDSFDMPVNAEVIDSELNAGDDLMIAGKGYKAGEIIVFESKDSQVRFQSIIEAEKIDPDGIYISLPEGFKYGIEYNIYLVRGIERGLIGTAMISKKSSDR